MRELAMSEQDGTQATAKRHRSHRTSKHNDTQGQTSQRPASDDEDGWRAYWKAQGQPWRTEPEIDAEQQNYLAERRKITPNIEQGIYPFKDIEPKLTRADLEWLLATHENGRGPVDWNDESQQWREGLDLRGANLRQANLSGLPLAHLRGGLTMDEWLVATEEQRNMAAAQVQGANLEIAHLQEANLRGAYLQGAILNEAQLQKANLNGAHL